VTRLGGNEVIKFDARLIIATHKDIAEEVKKGNFREDLYYRIMGLTIELPPLRHRGNDILILAKHFLDEFARSNKMGTLTLTKDAKDKLLKYSYPGNVRELKAIIDLAAVMSENQELTAEDITFNSIRQDDFFMMQTKSLRAHVCDIVKYHLKENNNDVIAVANILEIGKSTIYKMLKDKEISL